jgi:hypothetical protein
MLFDDGKTILLISPQAWDGPHVSKHNYAKELAASGNTVFFINPPTKEKKFRKVRVEPTEVPAIDKVSYATWFPYRLKFHARALFDRLMRIQAKRILRALGRTPDIVWDFDNAYQFSDLSVFGGKLNIFHLMDGPPPGLGSKRADIVLSIAASFVERAGGDPAHTHIVAHGLRQEYVDHARQILLASAPAEAHGRRPCVGYLGNLDHPAIDWPVIRCMVDAHPEIDFVFIGPHSVSGPLSAQSAVEYLSSRANCVLVGAATADEILARSADIDLWLICYDVGHPADAGINSHKIMELLATGKAILSNRFIAYADSDLMYMMPGAANDDMPRQLSDLIHRLDDINAPELQKRRATFALQHSYHAQLRKIDAILMEAETNHARASH